MSFSHPYPKSPGILWDAISSKPPRLLSPILHEGLFRPLWCCCLRSPYFILPYLTTTTNQYVTPRFWTESLATRSICELRSIGYGCKRTCLSSLRKISLSIIKTILFTQNPSKSTMVYLTTMLWRVTQAYKETTRWSAGNVAVHQDPRRGDAELEW